MEKESGRARNKAFAGLRRSERRPIARMRILIAKTRPGIVPSSHFLYNRAAKSYEDRINAIFQALNHTK